MNISNCNVDGINHSLPNGFTAKRGRLDTNEIIIGRGSNVNGAITVKLRNDVKGRPAWYVATFKDVTPKDVSEYIEIGLPENLEAAYHWGDMLKLVKAGTLLVS